MVEFMVGQIRTAVRIYRYMNQNISRQFQYSNDSSPRTQTPKLPTIIIYTRTPEFSPKPPIHHF